MRPAPPTTEIDWHHVKLVAHRGAHAQGFTENTLESFRKSHNCGAWGIELDVRWTADDVAIVHHDENCTRLFNRPDLVISKTNFADLRGLIPQIPTLSEVVTEFGKRKHLMIELKAPPSSLQQRILNELTKELTPVKDFHWLCLDPRILDAYTTTDSKAKVAVAELNRQTMFSHAIKNNWGGVAAHYTLLKSQLISELHQKGLAVAVGYVSSRRAIEIETHRKVDWLFTNQIESAPKWREHTLDVASSRPHDWST